MLLRKKVICTLFALSAVALAFSGHEAKAKKTVKKVSLSKAKITLSKKTYTYSGKERKPKLTVKYKKKTLKKNKDYKVTYSNNIVPGTAVAKITAVKKSKKNKNPKYKGSKKVKYTITKALRTIDLTDGKTAYTAVEGDAPFIIPAKLSKGTTKLTYTSSNKKVVTVSSTGKVTVVKRGTANITIKSAAGKYYEACQRVVPVTITKFPVRDFNTITSIKNFDYKTKIDDLNDRYANLIEKPEVSGLTDEKYTVMTKYILPGLATTSYDDYVDGYTECRNLCPQGICFAENYMLTTAYCVDGTHNSCVFVFDRVSGAYLKTIVLATKAHVGGITYDGSNVWICNAKDTALQKITFSALKKYVSGAKGKVKITENVLHGVENTPSSVAYNKNDGLIWVSEFVSKNDYKKKENRPYLHAYKYVDGKLEEQSIPVYGNPLDVDFFKFQTRDLTEEDLTNNKLAATASAVTCGALVTWIDGQSTKSDGVKEISMYNDSEEKVSKNVKINDIVVQVDDEKVESMEDFLTYLSAKKEGDEVKIIVKRYDAKAKDYITLHGVTTCEKRVQTDESPMEKPLPHSVQGIAFSSDGKLVLSRSYCRTVGQAQYISQIDIYDNVDMLESVQQIAGTSEAVPNKIIVLPPMVENVAFLPEQDKDGNDDLFMIFESAASVYLEGTDGKGKGENPIDKIISVKFKIETKN